MEENTYLSLDEVFFLWSNYSILYVPPARPSVLVSDAQHHTEVGGGAAYWAKVDSPIVGVGESFGSVQFMDFTKTLCWVVFWL